MTSNKQWIFRIVCLAIVFTALGYFAGVIFAPKDIEAQTCRPYPSQAVVGGACMEVMTNGGNGSCSDMWGQHDCPIALAQKVFERGCKPGTQWVNVGAITAWWTGWAQELCYQCISQ